MFLIYNNLELLVEFRLKFNFKEKKIGVNVK